MSEPKFVYVTYIGRVFSQGVGKRHSVAFPQHFVIVSICNVIGKRLGETAFCFPRVSPNRGGLA